MRLVPRGNPFSHRQKRPNGMASRPPHSAKMTATEVIMSYRTLLQHSTKMLDSVRNEDWEALIELEIEYVREVERLSQAEAEVTLTEAEQLEKYTLLSTIMRSEERRVGKE